MQSYLAGDGSLADHVPAFGQGIESTIGSDGVTKHGVNARAINTGRRVQIGISIRSQELT